MKTTEEIINEVHDQVSKEMPNLTDAHNETWEIWAQEAEKIGKIKLAAWIRKKDLEFEEAQKLEEGV